MMVSAKTFSYHFWRVFVIESAPAMMRITPTTVNAVIGAPSRGRRAKSHHELRLG